MQAISATSRSELVQPHHRRQPNLLTRFLLFVEALIVFMSLASLLVWSTTQFSSGKPFPVLSQLAFLWTTSASTLLCTTFFQYLRMSILHKSILRVILHAPFLVEIGLGGHFLSHQNRTKLKRCFSSHFSSSTSSLKPTINIRLMDFQGMMVNLGSFSSGLPSKKDVSSPIRVPGWGQILILSPTYWRT
ncbi:hypothetical protein L210DRAFT_2588725 [Boletus edulis BED1]|uniref:Uncharacterized protein n=1 Tax=Boletus edulis BED1 TaxID=1328754 RepID=A0AAD4BM96_BOLED|nr:hypothetical protein L210DRAFT_2588725 [Boletus edulis BED1]